MKKTRGREIVSVRRSPSGAVVVTERTSDGEYVTRSFEGQVPQKYLERLPEWDEYK